MLLFAVFFGVEEALQKLNDLPKQVPAKLELRYPANEVFVLRNQELLASEGTPLVEEEKKDAELVFGKSLDVSVVRVSYIKVKTQWFMTWGNVIRVPPAQYDRATLIHELMHVYQYQHNGTRYISRSLNEYACAWFSKGDRGKATDFTLAEGKSLFDYGVEQQAAIVETWYRSASARKDARYKKLMEELRSRPPARLTTAQAVEDAAGSRGWRYEGPDDGRAPWAPQLELRF